MSPRLPSLFHLLAIGLLATGCASSREQTYHVTVVNEAGAPVTLWIAKEGQPFEAHWSTPSQWQSAREAGAIPDDAPSLGVELPPARRVELGPQSGRFRRDARAVLYVFSAPVSLEEMAATPRRGTLSDIVNLVPGRNYVRVSSASPVQADRVRSLGARRAAAGGRSQ